MKNIKNIFYVGMLALCTMSFTACSDEETYDFPGDPYNHVYLQDKGNVRSKVLLHLSILRYQVLVL